MRKIRNLDWGQYRHPEFLQTLNISVNELKFIRMFLKRGSVELINEVLRERKSKQNDARKDDYFCKYLKTEKMKV
ncbi:MAG: hypothetical protein EAX91_01940 [Candidatus Lokiarchaeota archaeon]|nr:hypothetical protein [Candidatus Lokiarchaeota archaeon]